MKSWIWTHFRYDVMSRDCTNLRTTPSLFKKMSPYSEGFCLHIWTTWGYFELLGLSLECAFTKTWSDPNPFKTKQNLLQIPLYYVRDYGIMVFSFKSFVVIKDHIL